MISEPILRGRAHRIVFIDTGTGSADTFRQLAKRLRAKGPLADRLLGKTRSAKDSPPDMTDVATWIQQDLEELKEDPEFLTQGLLLEVNETVCELMEDQGVSRAELARRLKWPRSAVTKMLRGNHNISIGRLMKVALALGHMLTAPKFVPLVSRLQLTTTPSLDADSEDYSEYGSLSRTYKGVSFSPLETGIG